MKEIEDYCPFCNFKSEISHGPHNDYVDINCPHCGNYRTIEFGVYSSDLHRKKDEAPIISHWIRKNQITDGRIKLDADKINEILNESSLPSPSEQAENFIRLIAESVRKPDEFYSEEYHLTATKIGSYDAHGVKYVINHLVDSGIINAFEDSGSTYQVYLTFYGWETYEKIKREVSDSKIAFMAMKYGDETLEKIYKEHLKSTVNATGFELRRLDEGLKAGLIDDQLRIEIRKSRFLLADLTHGNYGSYWEAGYAEGLDKPVIYLCRKKIFDEKKTHFDTNHLTTITWELKTIETDMKKLKATIRTTFPIDAKMEDE